METLKALIDLIKELPTTALWVLLGFAIYKLSIVASIYGVIRLFINKAHEWAMAKKAKPKIIYRDRVVEVPMIPLDLKEKLQDAHICITGVEDHLLHQLNRLRLIQDHRSQYIHAGVVNDLAEAITIMINNRKDLPNVADDADDKDIDAGAEA